MTDTFITSGNGVGPDSPAAQHSDCCIIILGDSDPQGLLVARVVELLRGHYASYRDRTTVIAAKTIDLASVRETGVYHALNYSLLPLGDDVDALRSRGREAAEIAMTFDTVLVVYSSKPTLGVEFNEFVSDFHRYGGDLVYVPVFSNPAADEAYGNNHNADGGE